jgi:hypothetical protein
MGTNIYNWQLVLCARIFLNQGGSKLRNGDRVVDQPPSSSGRQSPVYAGSLANLFGMTQFYEAHPEGISSSATGDTMSVVSPPPTRPRKRIADFHSVIHWRNTLAPDKSLRSADAKCSRGSSQRRQRNVHS